MATATRSTGYAQQPGVALIVNQRDYGGGRLDRAGSDADRRSLEDLFEVMGYERVVVNDCASHELLDYIDDAVGQYDRDHDGPFFLCILAHGEKESITFKDGHSIETVKILDHMQGLRRLHGKPKIVIIESCRGTNLMTLSRDGAAEIRTPSYFGLDGVTGERRDPAADLLVFWSCLQGRVSYIHSQLGSWFINVLCDSILEKFYRYPKQPLSFLSITPVVNGLMEKPFYLCGNGRAEKVFKTSEVRHTLTADLLLSPAPGARAQQLLEPAFRRVRCIHEQLRAISRDPNSTSPTAAAASTSGPVDELVVQVQAMSLGEARAAQPVGPPVRRAPAAQPARAPVGGKSTGAARREDADIDVECDCRDGCDRRCPCDGEGFACVAECHGGRSCGNAPCCRCEKIDCRTNKCGCFKDGWLCDEDCHRGAVAPNCRNRKPSGRRRRARD